MQKLAQIQTGFIYDEERIVPRACDCLDENPRLNLGSSNSSRKRSWANAVSSTAIERSCPS